MKTGRAGNGAFWTVSGILIVALSIFAYKTLFGGAADAPARPSKPRPAAAGRPDAPATRLTSAAAYGIIAKRNLFRGRTPAPPAPPASAGTTAPSTGEPVFTFTPTTPTPGVPQSTTPKLAYTGKVDTANGVFVLLENLDTKRSQYVKVGDYAFGCKVVDATAQSISLDYNGESLRLELGANKKEDYGAPQAPPAAAPGTAAAAPTGTTPNAAVSTTPGAGTGGTRQFPRRGLRQTNDAQ